MDMRLWRRLGLALSLLVLPAPWSGPALAADAAAGASPDLHLSISETLGETTVRVPLASEGYRLYGLLSPYLSLGSATTLGVPWSASLVPGLQRDTDGLDDVRLGAGRALPLSARAPLYRGYRFLRRRIRGGARRRPLQPAPHCSRIP